MEKIQDNTLTINKINRIFIDELSSEYQNLSSDGVVALCRESNSVVLRIAGFPTMIKCDMNEYIVDRLNDAIRIALMCLVGYWGTYKSVNEHKTHWEIEPATFKYNANARKAISLLKDAKFLQGVEKTEDTLDYAKYKATFNVMDMVEEMEIKVFHNRYDTVIVWLDFTGAKMSLQYHENTFIDDLLNSINYYVSTKK